MSALKQLAAAVPARGESDPTSPRLCQATGVALVVGGILDFVAGILHPQGSDGSFHATIAEMLKNPRWPAAHWVAIAAFAVLATGVWLLADTRAARHSTLARIGARMLQVGAGIMIVEVAVEIASRQEAAGYAAGSPAPLVSLTEPLQTIGWPAFGFGLAALALGLRSVAPRLIGLLGAIGGLGMALGGVLTMGFHVTAAGPLFILGALTALWLVWAGVSFARVQSILDERVDVRGTGSRALVAESA